MSRSSSTPPAALPRTPLRNGSIAPRVLRVWSMAPTKCTRWCWRNSCVKKAAISGCGVREIECDGLVRDCAGRLLLLQARVRDDTGPSIDFRPHALVEFLRRQSVRFKADFLESRFDAWVVEDLCRGAGQNINGRIRHRLWAVQRIPRRHDVVRHAGFCHRWDFR